MTEGLKTETLDMGVEGVVAMFKDWILHSCLDACGRKPVGEGPVAGQDKGRALQDPWSVGWSLCTSGGRPKYCDDHHGMVPLS